MILTKHVAEKLLANNFNTLELKYPHFANDLSNTQIQIKSQLDELYDHQPTDLKIYTYLDQHDIDLTDLNNILSYRDYKRLNELIK